MANYMTYLGDKAVLIEAPVSGGLSKSETEGAQPDPKRAIANIIETVKNLVDYAGNELGPTLRKSGAAFEMSFAVRADTSGIVMISEHATVGQFQCTVKWPPARPVAPGGAPPTPARPALPQRDQG